MSVHGMASWSTPFDWNFGVRAHDRILKVAWTFVEQEKINGDNVLEAVNYRTLERAMWN